jgi:hypothetical protein
MTIEITLQPMFWLQLKREDVEVLLLLSEHHYDSECRQAGKIGNFLYGWRNVTGCVSEGPAPKCHASRRDLDTTLKICEGMWLAVRARLITMEDAQRIDALCAGVMTALDIATRVCGDTKIDPVTAPSERGRLMWATHRGKL